MAVLFCLILSSLIWALPASAASDTVSNCPKCGLYTIKIRPLNEPTCVDAGRGVQVCTNNLCRYEGSYVIFPAKGHSGTASNGDCTKQVRCSTCSSTIGTQSAHTYASSTATRCNFPGCSQTRAISSKVDTSSKPDTTTTPNTSGATSASSNSMYQYAFNIYKIARNICVPLAILSLASCGFTFLGSIFFGNYASMASNDMMKAKKQFIYTIIALVVIVFLPAFFNEATAFFRQYAWRP